MLVLTRKSHEQIQIGDNITITILRVKGGAVRVGVDAPRNVTVLRKELTGKPARTEKAQIEAVATSAPVAVAASTTHRRTAEGAASILSGGKSKALATCPANDPRRSRLVRAASPLSGYMAQR
jgi:carbon storage regulator CsrA